jgi:transcriptional regulator with XRE-family HTH domain
MNANASREPSGTSLKDRRADSGLSQQALAERAGCSIGMVRLLEQGLQPSQSEVLARIETVLAEGHSD